MTACRPWLLAGISSIRTTPKYFESKFNKDLEKSKTFRLVLQWLETAEFPEDDDVDGVHIVPDAILLLSDVPSRIVGPKCPSGCEEIDRTWYIATDQICCLGTYQIGFGFIEDMAGG